MEPILTAQQFREADQATIASEPITSIDLMERASQRAALRIIELTDLASEYHLVCGTGNNGGDGLAIARIIAETGRNVAVTIIPLKRESEDFGINLERLQKLARLKRVNRVETTDELSFEPSQIIIDAIFGTGFSGTPDEKIGEIIDAINRTGNTIISIDLPSGLPSDEEGYTPEFKCIKSNYTLTFQHLKPTLVLPETGWFAGKVETIDIRLNRKTIDDFQVKEHLIEGDDIKKIIPERNEFSHKGNFGHALLLGGSLGKMGAAVLATKTCLRSGCGLTTAVVPNIGYSIIQTAAPSAMCTLLENENIISGRIKELDYNALGFGPGVGTEPETASVLKQIIQDYNGKLIIDADGLNILADNLTWLAFLPKMTILTPHIGEFRRLAGSWENDFERNQLLKDLAVKNGIIVILKGKYTVIADPNGNLFYNPTGNSGMAKGGSGDVLTGLLTGLCARGLHPFEAAITATYLHGLAGDLASERFGIESMNSEDIVTMLPEAFKTVQDI